MKVAYTKYIVCLSFLALLLLSSCGSLSNIGVDYDDDVELSSVRGSRAVFTIPITVDNPTSHVLKLKKVEFDIYRNGYTFAALSLPEKVKVSARSNRQHTLKLQIHFKNVLALLDDDFDIEEEKYTLTGFVKVGVGLLSKKLKFEDITFLKLISELESL